MWKGRSSQWLNIGHYTAALLLAAAIIAVAVLQSPLAYVALLVPIGYAVWRFLVLHTHTYELTTQRLRITWGVINQNIDEIELYRVKDTIVLRTWWMRLTGLSSIFMETSDRSMPTLEIPALKNGVEMRETLRKQVEIQREKKRVREMDFDEAGSDVEM